MSHSFNKSFIIILFVQNVVLERNTKVKIVFSNLSSNTLLRFSFLQFYLFCKTFLLLFFEYSFFIALCSCLISSHLSWILMSFFKSVYFSLQSLFLSSCFLSIFLFVCFLSLSFILHAFFQCHLLQWGRKADWKIGIHECSLSTVTSPYSSSFQNVLTE